MATAAPIAPTTSGSSKPPIQAPQSLDSLGMRRNFLEDLALKTLYQGGEMSLVELARQMCLSLAIVEELFQRLRKEQLCEVKGMDESVYRITTTIQGRSRALELLSQSQYFGAAPVCLTEYVERVRAQSVRATEVHPADVERALASLVLNPMVLRQLGVAITSGTSIFLYGPAGTGKTSVAEALPAVYGDAAYIPHALEVDNQVITIFDPVVHQPLENCGLPEFADHDRRWVLCRRPRILAGGELSMEMLELQMHPVSKFYAAPLQLKANNGVLIIDDFGRQHIQPEEMLNRWIVPLDRRIDFLALAGGKKFEIPFDLFVVFATNLDPKLLADEAFLRRIQNKVKLDHVTTAQFKEIFQRVCSQYGVEYSESVVNELIEVLTNTLKQPLRPSYPRDLIQQICSAARYEGKQPQLDRQSTTLACSNYFLAE